MKENLIFECVLIKETKGFSSVCLNLDVASQGETKKLAIDNLKEAIELYVETTVENNLPIIRPIPMDENPLNARSEDIVKKFIMKIDLKIKAYAA